MLGMAWDPEVAVMHYREDYARQSVDLFIVSHDKKRSLTIKGYDPMNPPTDPQPLHELFQYLACPGQHVEITVTTAEQTIQFLKETV